MKDHTARSWEAQSELYINCLGLGAARGGLQSLCADFPDRHIHLQMDNTTAVAYVRGKGGIRSQCSKRDMEICPHHNLWLSVSHTPGMDNVQADTESRVFTMTRRNRC